MSENPKISRQLTPSQTRQITVLKTMSASVEKTSVKQFHISEISSLSGICDEREVQRYLFILEGQKLVSPFPENDFTSSSWQITNQGLKAVELLSSQRVQ